MSVHRLPVRPHYPSPTIREVPPPDPRRCPQSPDGCHHVPQGGPLVCGDCGRAEDLGRYVRIWMADVWEMPRLDRELRRQLGDSYTYEHGRTLGIAHAIAVITGRDVSRESPADCIARSKVAAREPAISGVLDALRAFAGKEI